MAWTGEGWSRHWRETKWSTLLDDLRSAGRRFYWMQHRVHGFVTERHIQSQAIRGMNAHTVQHGSLWVFTFFAFSFISQAWVDTAQSTNMSQRYLQVRFMWRGRHFRKEFKSLDFSCKETVTTSEKWDRCRIKTGVRGSLLPVWWKIETKLTLGQISACKLLYCDLTGGSEINVSLFHSSLVESDKKTWSKECVLIIWSFDFTPEAFLMTNIPRIKDHTDSLILTPPAVLVRFPFLDERDQQRERQTGFSRLFNPHYIQETHN